MPDFKIVISDPQTKEPNTAKVKVKVSDAVQVNQGEKDGKAIPSAKLNEKTKQDLGLDQFVTVEIEKQEGDKKLKIKGHFKVEVDNSVPQNEIWISQQMGEKFGANEFEAIAYRTKAFQVSVDQSKVPSLIGAKIGDVVDVNISGVPMKLKITGGSDNSGFPMRFDVQGGAKRRLLLSSPPGFYPTEDGMRKKKTVRGNMITAEIVQINTILVR